MIYIYIYRWISSSKSDTLLPIARPNPHGTAEASMSPACVLRFFLTLNEEKPTHDAWEENGTSRDGKKMPYQTEGNLKVC